MERPAVTRAAPEHSTRSARAVRRSERSAPSGPSQAAALAVAEPAAADPLVFHRERSGGAHAEGCYASGGAFIWDDGSTAPLRSKASNRCPGCARAVAYENMTILRMDAEDNDAPGHVVTLTSRDPVTDAGAYRNACAVFWRAFRRRWGHVEYCGFIEWTTGEKARDGQRRMHSHWLLKGLVCDDVAEVQEWVSVEWAKLTGAWVVQLAELRTVGGIVGYLALHHEKMSQAPPEGWRGMRFRPSRGYFSEPVWKMRERARSWLASYRADRDELSDGERITLAQRGSPRVVFRPTVAERELARLSVGPPAPGYFDSLPARRALDAQLMRAARARADETVEDYYARAYAEMVTTLTLRSRARRRLRSGGVRPDDSLALPGQ